ncbi:hypothetical protein JCM10213_008831 [Rhodosporidiobolus nylandii]
METAVPLPQELRRRLAGAVPRLKPNEVELLVFQLSTLWLGIRTAVLVDCVLLSEDEARKLGDVLSKSPAPLFVVYEPSTGQTLGVNWRHAQYRQTGETYCTEVGGKTPVLLEQLPLAAVAILEEIGSQDVLEPFLLLEPVEQPHDLVGAVGHLLDYPVPYCISNSTGQNCLGGVELVVIESLLVGPGGRQRLNSFSYPAMFDGEPLEARLCARVVARGLEAVLIGNTAEMWEHFPELERCTIESTHYRKTLDQVAL